MSQPNSMESVFGFLPSGTDSRERMLLFVRHTHLMNVLPNHFELRHSLPAVLHYRWNHHDVVIGNQIKRI